MLYGTPGTVLTRACLGDRAGAKRVSGKTPCRQPGECELPRMPISRSSRRRERLHRPTPIGPGPPRRGLSLQLALGRLWPRTHHKDNGC
jgi:hypothetical protein